MDSWVAWQKLARDLWLACGVVDVALFAGSERVRRLPPPPGAAWLRLTKRAWALVDKADFEAVSQLSWHLYTPSKAAGKRKRRTRYARTTFYLTGRGDNGLIQKRKVSIYLHRWLWARWGLPPAEHIDHDGGDGLDCRRSKLRAATRFENQRARSYTNSLGLRGVKQEGNRFVARITADGKRQVLGRFSDAETAARAYDAAAYVLHKAFAMLNFDPC